MADFDLIGNLRGKVPDEMLNPREVSKEEEDLIVALVVENIENEKE